MKRRERRHNLKTNRIAQNRRRRGIAMAWTAIVLIVMIGMVGLSIDWGKLVWNAHQMQNAADAAALAGAQIVKQDPAGAIQRTHDFALANSADQKPVTLRTTAQPTTPFTGDDPALDIVLGRWVRYNHTFIATLDAPNAVKAVARRNTALGDDAPALALVFGPIFGTDTVDATRDAVAWCNSSGGAGLICLSESAVPGLYLSGTADLDIQDGGIHVNSTIFGKNNKAGSWVSGNATLDCGFINVVGGIDPPPDSSTWESIFARGDVGGFSVVDGTTTPVPEHIDDPLASRMLSDGDPYVDATTGDHLELPGLIDTVFPTRTQTVEGTPISAPIGATCTLAPGYYPYGIRLTTAGQTITLDPTADTTVPPIYIFGGGRASDSDCGLFVNGGNVIGEGVTCYVTKSYGLDDKWGVTRLMGNGTIRILSPGDLLLQTDPTADVDGLEGIAIWQDPANPNYAHLNGGGTFSIKGTIYFPNPILVRLEGNLGEAGNQILCGSAEVLGKAVINVNYDQRNIPGLAERSLLVQ